MFWTCCFFALNIQQTKNGVGSMRHISYGFYGCHLEYMTDIN